MYTLLELFYQAQDDYHSKPLHDKGTMSYMCHGFKIIKEVESEVVLIMDMAKGGDFYKEVSQDEYDIFFKLGWKKTIYVLYLSNCRTKLSKLETRIQNALVNNDSVKTIRKLKASREQILRNFNKVKIKLN
jgi:hypothetical protein|tara:strand:+ start:11545 stop:11937 length:393 start_codon:yes stop_codon:yes gene_type:complete